MVSQLGCGHCKKVFPALLRNEGSAASLSSDGSLCLLSSAYQQFRLRCHLKRELIVALAIFHMIFNLYALELDSKSSFIRES